MFGARYWSGPAITSRLCIDDGPSARTVPPTDHISEEAMRVLGRRRGWRRSGTDQAVARSVCLSKPDHVVTGPRHEIAPDRRISRRTGIRIPRPGSVLASVRPPSGKGADDVTAEHQGRCARPRVAPARAGKVDGMSRVSYHHFSVTGPPTRSVMRTVLVRWGRSLGPKS
jgi:hypothetical protein